MKRFGQIKILAIVLLVIFVAGCTPTVAKPPLSTASPKPTVVPNSQTNFEIGKMDPNKDQLTTQAKIDKSMKTELKRGYKISNPFVALNPYGISPLSALVMFQTKTATKVSMTVFGHDRSVDIKNTFPSGTTHILPVYGLYPGEKNKVEFVIEDGSKNKITIETDPLESVVTKATVLKKVKGQFTDGLTFCDPSNTTAESVSSMAYDSNGDIRWYLNEEGRTKPTRRLANGRIMSSTVECIDGSYYSVGLREMDLIGKIYAVYVFPGGQHHDFIEMPNGNLVICGNSPDQATREDYVYELSRKTGKVVKTFDMKKYFDITDGQSINKKPGDWFHLNALNYNQKTNTILFSARNLDGVVGINYTTKKMKWFLGDSEGWSKLDPKMFFKPKLTKLNSFAKNDFQWAYAQHAASFLPDGDIIMFDNGSYRAKKSNREDLVPVAQNYSRGVRYHINTKDMTVEQVWSFGKERGDDWYSSYISDIDYVAKGHYIMTSGALLSTSSIAKKAKAKGVTNTASVVEVKDNKVVFELLINVLCYRTERMQFYTETNTYDMNQKGKYYGSFGKQVSRSGASYNLDSQTPPDFDLKVNRSYGRVVISGTWNSKNFPSGGYAIIINKSTNETLVTRLSALKGGVAGQMFYASISSEGLKGKYQLFMTASGKTYKSNYVLTF